MTEILVPQEMQKHLVAVSSMELVFHQGAEFHYDATTHETKIKVEGAEEERRGEIIPRDEDGEIEVHYPSNFYGTELIIQAIHDPSSVDAIEKFFSMKKMDWAINAARNNVTFPAKRGEILGYTYETSDYDVLICGGDLAEDKWERGNGTVLKFKLQNGESRTFARALMKDPSRFLQTITDVLLKKDGFPVTRNSEIEVLAGLYGTDSPLFTQTPLKVLAINETSLETVEQWKERLKVLDSNFC